MPLFEYKIDKFFGIDQSSDGNNVKRGFSSDAVNMNTDDGNLAVAKGFVKYIESPVPGIGEVKRCIMFRHSDRSRFLVFTEGALYVGDGSLWVKVSDLSLSEYSFDAIEATIGTHDYLIIGNGETGLLKFDGTLLSAFGSEEGMSRHPVRYLAMYKSRLFAAGDRNHPNRLYWSQLPGDDRSIEDWSPYEASPNVEGGHIEVGLFNNDPITALVSLTSQLLIFKRNSLYRLYGDKPSNFTLEKVESGLPPCSHTGIAHYGDAAYFMTDEGLYLFDGVNAYLNPDSLCINKILENADTSDCKSAGTGRKLYFIIKHNGEDAVIEYDLLRRTYMLRNGFDITDMFTYDNKLLMINNDRHIYEFNKSNTYDGEPINAYWKIPYTDLGRKASVKKLKELFVRADSSRVLSVEIDADRKKNVIKKTLNVTGVTEIPLRGEGRGFGLCLSNEDGGFFKLSGGLEILLEMRERSR